MSWIIFVKICFLAVCWAVNLLFFSKWNAIRALPQSLRSCILPSQTTVFYIQKLH
jgi:hypothetical protein